MPPEFSAIPPELPRTDPVAPARPWGPWATIGWSILIVVGAVAAQAVVTAIFAALAIARGERVDPDTFGSDGNLLAVATCASGVMAFALSIFFAAVRKGISLKDYLALRLPSKKELARWSVYLLLFVLVTDGMSFLLGKPIVPDVMVEIYRSADWALPFLWFALFLGAPLSEEFFFRGFLFAGLQQSRLGSLGAIILTSVVWASIHVQYDLYGMMVIFLGGLVLGFARVKTSSLWLCVMLHGLMNLIATSQLLIKLAMTA